ncbi:MAG TPA: phosphoribosylglycinamide formyltransferase [Leptospiraceae bacterium]|nr:phosphoribosylglycinamide formyltransferase [Leptospiraceae bacterium]HMW05616.1 phosphoribosylglycinamide formyltransferase [Leptospiraceae bacterium]HMX34502.1 phosphoribosylglycinamide formyltransferase [Leptospiraceae bacterium]HMY31125.1 phosphoribosylglycinamide formyltransferase [Leptospiraceae bacterium]HMZ63708.1 phosphoribosylglycinamide formyltransferase [Leptospiraceae bacterium]
MQKKIVFLCSGKGSNFKAVVQHIQNKSLDVQIAGLISDKEGAGALTLAKEFGIPTHVIPFDSYRNEKDRYHELLEELLLKLSPDLIVTAGYMRIIKGSTISRFENKMINIHPSLLPSFKGLKAIEQAMEYGVRFTGCTTHFVEEGIDSGPIILQSIVEILPNSTISDLTQNIHAEEHKILPLSVEYFIQDKIQIEGRKVFIRE